MKLKRILSLVCICTLLFANVTFAADYAALQGKTAELSRSLAAGENVKKIVGNAVILIAENDVLNALASKGAVSQVFELKQASDNALNTADKKTAENLLAKLNQAVDVLCGVASPVLFTDVNSGDWYFNAVTYSVMNGIFKGMSDTQFAPNMEITRGMFLTLMGRLYKKDAVKYSSRYPDVADDAYYAEAVNWAKAKGVLDFITEEKFYPDKPITREELVTVLRGCVKLSGENVDSLSVMKSFTDSSKISDWAKSSVEWAMTKKIVSGFEDGSFRPQTTATRAQVAQIFYNQK